MGRIFPGIEEPGGVLYHHDGVVYHHAIARIKPNKVNVLMEKPKAAMTASVPINETGIVMNGMTTARKFCKNKKMTKTTSKVVSKNVISTSWMEASITSVVSKVTLYSTPSGKELPNSFILAFTTFDTSKELSPALVDRYRRRRLSA